MTDKVRKLKVLIEEENEAAEKLWYFRSLGTPRDWSKTPPDIIEERNKKRAEVESKYPLFCYSFDVFDDFELGKLSGRLETLRWVMGDEKGNLDT